MRRAWIGFCCLVALVAAAAYAADDAGKSDTGPSLEYRPPRPIMPEPKGPTPAAPVSVFREYFGGFGIGKGSFDRPVDVAFGVEGRKYVLDAGNSRVQLFDRSNDFVFEWGSYGSDESRCQFKEPRAIFVVPGVRIECSNAQFPRRKYQCEVVLVLDAGNNRVQWFKVPFSTDPREKLPNLPCGHDASVFQRYKPPQDKGDVGDFGDWGEYGISDSVRFNRPRDIVFEPQRVRGDNDEALMLRVLDAGNERIQRFPLTFDCANDICFPDRNLSQDTISNLTRERGNLEGQVSLALSREGSFDYLYLLGTGCSLQKFKFGTPLPTFLASSDSSSYPLSPVPLLDSTWPAVAPESGLCVPERVRYDERQEYVYVLDSGNSLLSIFHRSGNFISALRGAVRSFDEPGGFDLRSESGEFVLADTGNDLVQMFTLR